MSANGGKLNRSSRNGRYAKWTAVVCLALIVICGVVKSMHLDSAEIIRPDAGLISLNEEGSISSSADGEKYRSECIYTIPENMDEGMMLSVESRQDYLKVTLDGEVLLTNDDREKEEGIIISMVPIPDDAGGRELMIYWENSTSQSGPVMYLGSQNEIYLHYLTAGTVPAFFGGMYILLGIVILASTAFVRGDKGNVNRKTFLHLGAFILFTGLWTLTDSRILQMVTGRTAVITFVTFISFTLMPLSFTLFFKDILTFPRKIITALYRVQMINAVFVGLCYLTGVLSLYTTLISTHILLVATVIFVVLTSLSEYRLYRSAELKKLLTGILLLVFFAVLSLASFYGNYAGSRYSLYYSFGLFSLIICLIGSFLDRLFREMKENVSLEAYKKIAFTDLMTGMRNRSAFNTDAGAWDDAPAGKSCTCIVFDVNNLKEINDTYGHFAGDDHIMVTAACIKACFSSVGKCYRIGGDEFVVVMEDASEDSVRSCLRSLRSTVDRENAGRENEISFAYGYATGEVASAEDFSRLCEKADENMYRQKEEMKNP